MFNNSNEAVNTNLQRAKWVNDSTFEYKGEIIGINTVSLEGVPTMDMNGNFYLYQPATTISYWQHYIREFSTTALSRT
jgi:hypothetical protein